MPYHAGEEKPYTCGTCHTTGWIPCPIGDDDCDRQDDLPGMAGSFAAPGVQCEACHGPGSLHAEHPYVVKAEVDRSPELCGRCHIRGAVESVNAKNGFIRHHEQYEELFAGKKHSMRCVDCHDPHKSVKFTDPEVNPTGGIRIDCLTCHVGYDDNQTSAIMRQAVECVDCHMPRMVKSAQGNAEHYTGDIRSHFFKINPDPDVSQFNEEGTVAMPFVTVDWACRHCHRDDGSALVKTNEELFLSADGYHSGEPD